MPRVNSDLWYFGHRGRASDSDVVVSMVLHSVGLETYLFSLSRDGNLRMWSCSRAQSIMVVDMLNNISDTGRNLTQGGKLLYISAVIAIFVVEAKYSWSQATFKATECFLSAMSVSL
jgi:membrane-associated HD superfamily phosphohydrolase